MLLTPKPNVVFFIRQLTASNQLNRPLS